MSFYEYFTPTKVVMGRESELETGKLVQAFGGTKVLIHYGGGSAIKSGLIDRVKGSLDAVGIPYVTLGGVVPNPRLSKIYEGIALCKAEGVDFILAVGGGSVIDSAKGIGYGMVNHCDVWDFYCGKGAPTGCLPLGAILTIAAAGSEMSNSSVITNEEGWLKRGCNHDSCRCKFAIMNPALTTTLPPYQTASGAVDILMHTMERYFQHGDGLEVTDSMAEALMRTVVRNAEVLMQVPDNYESRAELMWASSLSHNGFTNFGNGRGDWSCHQLEHELGGMFDVAHGAGLAAIWGSWARYVYKEMPARFARFFQQVLGLPNFGDDERTALVGIAAMEDYFRSLQMPTSISELGVELTEEQIDLLAEKCTFGQTRTVGNVKALNKEDIINIYRKAM